MRFDTEDAGEAVEKKTVPSVSNRFCKTSREDGQISSSRHTCTGPLSQKAFQVDSRGLNGTHTHSHSFPASLPPPLPLREQRLVRK